MTVLLRPKVDLTDDCRAICRALKIKKVHVEQIRNRIADGPNLGHLKYRLDNVPYAGVGFFELTHKFPVGGRKVGTIRNWKEYTTLHFYGGPYFEVYLLDIYEGMYFEADESPEKVARLKAIGAMIFETFVFAVG